MIGFEFRLTGKFVKTGTGTTIFSNTGTNEFRQGAEIDGGTLDIRTNLTALNQPWRYSFRQLDRDRRSGSSDCGDPCSDVFGTKTNKRQLWGETFGRYDDVDYDADIYRRAAMHVGQFGFTTRW